MTGPLAPTRARSCFWTASHRELTIEELRQVCSAATGELRTLFAIGLYSGLRLADAVTLQWGEVELIRRLILEAGNFGSAKQLREGVSELRMDFGPG